MHAWEQYLWEDVFRVNGCPHPWQGIGGERSMPPCRAFPQAGEQYFGECPP